MWTLSLAVLLSVHAPVALKARPFDLSQVKVTDPRLVKAAELNRQYLLSVDPGRLLHTFRLNAKLPTSAAPLGGWESPGCEVRGHCMGHWLSGLALTARSMGSAECRQRADYLVAELAKCQQALGGEWLSAFPESFLDRLEAGKPVWAPYYTLHKILAGLLDVHTLCGNAQALDVAKRLGRHFAGRNAKLNDQQMAVVHRNEYGGIGESLWNLYGLTGDEQVRVAAAKFDQESFLGPLAQHQDRLRGLHANTQIPKVIAAARRAELTGEERYHDLADYFFTQVTGHRSYVTGGTSNHEHWRTEPDKLASELSPDAHETCVSYNLLKLTDRLFAWSPEARYADYYERAFYNAILPTQEPNTGMLMYLVPMNAGHFKTFSTPLDSFWCCVGTGVESFARLGSSLYYHNNDTLWVNLYVCSELDWPAQGFALSQQCIFPDEPDTVLNVSVKQPVELTVNVRIPAWCDGASVTVNGTPVAGARKAGSYCALKRTWRDGDVIGVSLPMKLRLETTPDDPTVAAFCYGPLVLAGELGTERYDPAKMTFVRGQRDLCAAPRYEVAPLLGRADALDTWVKPVEGKFCTFTIGGQAKPLTLVPFRSLFGQRYAVYWRLFAPGSREQLAYETELARKAALRARFVDLVEIGDPESEREHGLRGERTNSGLHQGRHWRDAPGGWFTYQVKVLPDAPTTLVLTYWGDDAGNRVFDVLVDGQKIATQRLERNQPGQFFDVEHKLPPELTKGKEKVTVRLQTIDGSTVGGLFGLVTSKTAP